MYRSYSLNSRCLSLSHQKKKSNFQNQSIVNQHKLIKKFPYNTFLSPLWFPFGFWHCHLKNNITATEGCPLHPAHHVLLLANISLRFVNGADFYAFDTCCIQYHAQNNCRQNESKILVGFGQFFNHNLFCRSE